MKIEVAAFDSSEDFPKIVKFVGDDLLVLTELGTLMKVDQRGALQQQVTLPGQISTLMRNVNWPVCQLYNI